MLTSDARARTDVILTGQCESHFTTSFSANAICERQGEGFTSFNGNKLSNLCGEKKHDEAFRGVYFQRTREATWIEMSFS